MQHATGALRAPPASRRGPPAPRPSPRGGRSSAGVVQQRDGGGADAGARRRHPRVPAMVRRHFQKPSSFKTVFGRCEKKIVFPSIRLLKEKFL